jgi:hypothetical protein
MNMKKILLGVFAFLFAAATVFATQANQSVKANDPVYHWFDGQTYVGDGTVQDMSSLCNQVNAVECLGGYLDITGEERPSQLPDETIRKSN